MEPRTVVYVSNAGMHDYSSLLEWGDDMVYVTTGDIDRLNPKRLQLTIVSVLKDFTEHDFLVFSGSPIPFALSLAYLFSRDDLDQVRVLYWMRKTNSYFSVAYTHEAFLKAEEMFDVQ
jgi:hypothetical protein